MILYSTLAQVCVICYESDLSGVYVCKNCINPIDDTSVACDDICELSNLDLVASPIIDSVENFSKKICSVLNGSINVFPAYRYLQGQFYMHDLENYQLLIWGIEEIMAKSYDFYQNRNKLKSDLWLEFGVASGTSIKFIGKIRNFLTPSTSIFGFDWFFGLPDDWKGYFPRGTFSTNGSLPSFDDNINIVVGLFNQTLGPFLESSVNKHVRISFLNIDCDLYEPTLYILKLVVPFLRRGSIIHFHELVRWKEGNCEAHEELLALYAVADFHPSFRLQVLPYTSGNKEAVLFRVI